MLSLLSNVKRRFKSRTVRRAGARTRPAARRLCCESLEARTLLTTFTVLNTDDSGAGSFRQAIVDANANSGPDIIDFNIGGGAQTILLASGLPTVTDPVTIDSTTQPGVALDASGIGGTILVITASNSTVQDLAITNASGTALWVGGTGNLISSVDVSWSGSPASGTGLMLSSSSNNTIRNITATNRSRGILLTGASDTNLIELNNVSGSVTGIELLGTSSDNTIQQNDASGTSGTGISSWSATGTGNAFLSNDLSNSRSYYALAIGFDSQFQQSGNIFTGSVNGLALNNMTGLSLNPLTLNVDLTTFSGTSLRLDSVTHSTIDGLNLSWTGVGQAGTGIEFHSSSNNTISAVTATNRVRGIQLNRASNDNTIHCATILSNGTGIEVNATSSGLVVNQSHVEGNNIGIWNRTSTAALVDAENNYWGAPDGPSPIGSGDTILGNVDADPFLTGVPGVDTTPPEVLGVDVGAGLSSLIVQLNDDDLDEAGATQPGNYKVTAANGDADGNGDPFDDGDEMEVDIDSISYDDTSDRVTMHTVDLLFTDLYRLELDGDDATSDGTPGITDLAGNFINGGDYAAVLDTTVLAHPAVRTQELIDTVLDLSLHHGTENSLVAKLDGALEKLDDGNPNNDHAAVGKLNAFISEVEAQRGKKISEDNADELIAEASLIIQLMEDDLL